MWCAALAACVLPPLLAAEAPSPLPILQEKRGTTLAAQMQERETNLAARVSGAVVAVECHAGPRNERYYGAGVVVTPEGLVLSSTTAVPPGARRARVRFADGSSCPAEVAYSDTGCEVAVLVLKPASAAKSAPEDPSPYPLPGGERGNNGLRFLPVGDTARLRIGDAVYAAGNPHETLGRDGQVFWSAGVLSGRYRARSADESSRYAGEVLETDAAVNPGCDGGALVDGEGRLVGIVSLCFTRTRWLGTAVPLDRILARVPEAHRDRIAAASARQAPEAESAPTVSRVLRDAAIPAAAAVVSLHVRRPAREAVAEQAASSPRAAAVALQAPGASARAARPPGAVTGVLVEPRGAILTSAFNLDGAENRVDVVLCDGRRYRAKIRGRHVDLDVAVLQMEDLGDESLPMLALSPGAGAAAGSFVGVLGAPPAEGAETTWGCGIVSAPGRLEGLAVQMDAKTNYGNSGGPVVDSQGRLAGIVSQVGTRKVWAQNSGVGFFAPAERILAIWKELRSGKVLRKEPPAFLGVAPAVGETDLEGVKLATVVKDSPAWKGGLRAEDLITAVDGEPARSWPALLALLRLRRSGETVKVQAVRGAEPFVAPVVLGERKE
jgi:S1-C subfamily serine protease